MPKNIVLCSDGTGNTAIKGRGTNVFKLFEALDLQVCRGNSSIPTQIAFYDDGVGTQQFVPLKLLGGAFGMGLGRNVRHLYTELARVYEPGDRIYLFGFSRGAFTVRCLGGMIARIGIVKGGDRDEFRARVKAAYKENRRCYRLAYGRKPDPAADKQRALEFRLQNSVVDPVYAPDGRVPIDFIGVWDTVDAVGFPIAEASEFWNRFVYPFKFPDQRLSPLVKRACHALSLDDERYTFHPTLWDGESEHPERIEQTWFAGVHTNVGGGYPKQGMSMVTLAWMMRRAEQAGLRFLPSVHQLIVELQNVNDKLYNSRSGLATYYRYKPRDLGEIRKKVHQSAPPRVHMSVVERIALGTDGYSPGNIPANVEVVSKEEPAIAERLTQAIREACVQGAPMDAARGLIWLKRLSQGVTTALSFLVVAFAALTILVDPEVLRGNVALAVGVALVGLLAVMFLISLLSSKRMHRIYAEFWFQLRPKLRQILHGEQAAGAAG